MRATRLLRILLTLSVRGRVSAAALADELEVSLRTVYRDVDALNAAGVPVYATRGRSGGFQLLDGFRTRLNGMTADEADSLFLAGLPSAAADLGLGGVLAATQLKLLAALPRELRERAVHVRERFHVDSRSWQQGSEAPRTPPFLSAVAEAVWERRRIDVRYQRSDRSVGDRVLEPLGLVLKSGAWYLVASRPDDDRGPRTYRLERVHAAALRDETFEAPARFDLAAFWAAYQRHYEQRVYTATARIRVDERGRALLFLLGGVPARAAHAGMSAVTASGWTETTVPIESVRHAKHALLQLGEHVEVLEPAELRAAVAQSVRLLSDRYRGV